MTLEQYIEGLKIGQGRHAGKQFTLLPWQRKFLRNSFKQPGNSALSLSRCNGKTTFLSALAASCIDVDGPLVEPMAETLFVASSFEQGLIGFRHLKHFLRPTFERYGVGIGKRYRVQGTANKASIRDTVTGALIRVVGSDPRRLHGAAPKILILDEVAQWPHTQIDAMLAALTTSRGKIPDSRAIWIGTRPSSENHPFAKMLAGGAAYSQVHCATEQDPPFQRRTWIKANPSLDHMPDLEAIIRQEAELAKKDPSMLAAFKALRLNMGTSDILEATLLDADTWERIEGRPAGREGPFVLGLDVGAEAALTGAASYFWQTGRLEAFGLFPEKPDLQERGKKDGVGSLYADMARRGELLTAGEYAPDLDAMFSEVLRRWGRPAVIVADRWKEAELRNALSRAKFPMAQLVTRGMGFLDGSADIRAFRKACLTERVFPETSLLLRSAVGEARTVCDPAGNEKLAKATQGGRRLRARDDAAAAAILAVAEGERRRAMRTPAEPEIRIIRAA